jgi:acyl carrier protein
MTDALVSSLLAKVTAAIQSNTRLRDVQVTLETRFVEDLGLNSFGMTEIALRIKETSAGEFPQEVIARFRAVADMVGYLSRHFFTDSAESGFA